MIKELLSQANQIVADGGANNIQGGAIQVAENMTIDECAAALSDTPKAAQWGQKIEFFRSGESDLNLNFFRNAVSIAILTMDSRKKAIAARQK